jgi:hypothetical protein
MRSGPAHACLFYLQRAPGLPALRAAHPPPRPTPGEPRDLPQLQEWRGNGLNPGTRRLRIHLAILHQLSHVLAGGLRSCRLARPVSRRRPLRQQASPNRAWHITPQIDGLQWEMRAGQSQAARHRMMG